MKNLKELAPHLLLWLVFAMAIAFIPAPSGIGVSAAWSPAWDGDPLPRAGIHGNGVGLQVCVKEVDVLGNETLLGTNVIRGFPAARATRDQFAVNVSRMANDIVGPRSPYLLDVAMMKFVQKGAAVEAGSMTCVAAAAIYDTKGNFIDCMTVASAGCTVCRVSKKIQ